MKRAEAEKLLGGHAAGILTEAERRSLFEAALEHQDLFDALMDEEALRELLADPAARAHVLAALAPAPPRIVPFWRRPGVIGAAAGILMAATAGLAVLRSPEAQLPPAVKPAVGQAPTPASPLAPPASAPALPEAKAVPSPAAKAAVRPKEEAIVQRSAGVVASGNQAPAKETLAPVAAAPVAVERAGRLAETRQAEARDQLSRRAEAAGAARSTAVVEVLSSVPAPAATPAPAPRVAAKVMAPRPAGLVAAVAPAPVWTIEALPDDATLVTVAAPREAQVVLLRRGASGVEVLKPSPAEDAGTWQFRLRLASGDALDLYVMNGPVADPARLPETGPVDGFRARIHPPAKKKGSSCLSGER
ncbi:MAG TPA: hypothetical protein VGJ89_09870 [Geothrix sp.]|jgi:hypothetical protein